MNYIKKINLNIHINSLLDYDALYLSIYNTLNYLEKINGNVKT